MKNPNTTILNIALALCLSATTLFADNLTYPDLVERLYDLKRLATPPTEGVTSGSFTSRDLAATYNEETGKYENWWANSDGNGFVNPDDGTMMELEGPGVIWRIWSAQPKEGNLEFYVDGAKEPSAARPFIEMFTKLPYSDHSELVHMKGRGRNFFIPIPFQKSIRIRGAKDWGRFYQFTYTKFPKGTQVPSWDGTLDTEARNALSKANVIWAKRGAGQFVSSKSVAKEVELTVKPGETKSLLNESQPGAIVSIVMDRPQMERQASISILRELTIAMNWDGDREPAVWSPLGDFFGTGAGENLYKTLITGMTDSVYYANWYMPFEQAKIEITNDGTEARTLSFTIHTEKLTTDANKLLRFHYKWHRDDFTGFDEEQLWNDRWPDWPLLSLEGTSGRFVGFMAHMWNPNHLWNKGHLKKHAKPYPTKGVFKDINSPQFQFFDRHVIPKKYWWGEGDEKFFVDGEKMPSTFGTGTEDYFGYAWGTSQAFDSALQGQPINGEADEIGKTVDNRYVGNIGHISNVRWQVQDNVPFQKSFEATVEKYHPNSWPLLNAYTVAWYQEPGRPSPYSPVLDVKERSDYYVEATLKSPPVIKDGLYHAGVLQHLVILGQDETRYANPIRQGMEKGGGWSADCQWLIQLQRKDSYMTFSFHVSEELAQTTGRATIGLSKGPQYGIVDILINDKVVATGIDGYAEKLAPGLTVEIPDLKLLAGQNKIRIRVAGKGPKSKGFWAGLDYLHLK
jgi:hypothetical protein